MDPPKLVLNSANPFNFPDLKYIREPPMQEDLAFSLKAIVDSCFSFQGKFFHFLAINRHREIEYDLLYSTVSFLGRKKSTANVRKSVISGM